MDFLETFKDVINMIDDCKKLARKSQPFTPIVHIPFERKNYVNIYLSCSELVNFEVGKINSICFANIDNSSEKDDKGVNRCEKVG